MVKVLEKLATARLYIKSHPIKKDGRNTFSNYDYFTPEIVSKLVNDACNESNLICVFSLKQDNLGYYGEVVTTDLESGEQLITEMRTDRPDIKATNVTQQMGGMNTYAKRYALMSLFDIEDNTIDFDSHDNTAQSVPPARENDNKPWLNKTKKDGTITEEWSKVVAALKTGNYNITQVEAKYKISKSNKDELIALNK